MAEDLSDDAPAPGRRTMWVWPAAALAGAILALAYPGWNAGPALWFWMFPLLAALWLPPAIGKGKAFLLGWLAGFVFHFIVLRWLRDIFNAGPVLSKVGWLALSAYLGMFAGLWAVFATTVGRLARDRLLPERAATPEGRSVAPVLPASPSAGALAAPALHALRVAATNAAAWVFLEWFRGWFLTGFGWNGLGVAMHQNLALAQMAEFVGVSGLSFLPVFVSICAFATVWRIHQRMRAGHKGAVLNLDFTLGMAVLVGWFLFGVSRTMESTRLGPSAPAIEIAIIQRNIPQELKWEPGLAMDHTKGYLDAFAAAMQRREDAWETTVEAAMKRGGEVQLSLAGPEIVLMPESALPFYLEDPVVEEFRGALFDIAGQGTWLVTGINDALPGVDPVYFNTIAAMKDADGPVVSYRKRNLVPFGEYLPMRWFAPMRWLAGDAIPGDFTAGTSTEPMPLATRTGRINLIPLICFEDTLGRHARMFARRGDAQILCNTTNDGWFKDPAAAMQHAANAMFRCIELRRPMVRAANTGLSCVYDATGKVVARIVDANGSPQVAGVLFARVPLAANPPLTFFARFGDVFSFACGGLALLATLGHCVLRRRSGR